MGAAQTLAWPNPHVYVPTKSTAAEARPVSALGALIVCSDILQVLSLESWLRACKSVVCTAMRRDFSSSSLVVQPRGSAVVSAPPLHVGHTQALPRMPQSRRAHHSGVRRRHRPGMQEPSPAGALSSALRGRGQHMGREAAVAALPFMCHSTMALHSYGSMGFLHERSWLQSSCPLRLSACSQQQSSPRSTLQTTDTRLRLGHTGLWHRPSV